MSYESARDAAISTDVPAAVIAAAHGVSERTVYRYRRGGGARSSEMDARRETVRAIVGRHKGDAPAIVHQCRAAGLSREQVYYIRRGMVASGEITEGCWPAYKREGVQPRHWELLCAMVQAGATPLQVSRCFNITRYSAECEIRAAWAGTETKRRRA